MSTCTEIRSLLPLHVGDDLESPLAASVRVHLEGGCAECSAVLDELARSRDALRELGQRSPAPRVDLWPGVLGGLRAEGLVAAAPRRVARPLVLLGARAWLSAAALLIAAGGLFLGLRPAPGVPATSDALADSVVEPELAPVLVAGPQAGPQAGSLPLGGLRRLQPGETPFFTNARLYGENHPLVLDDVLLRRTREGDPSRPTLAGERVR